MSRPYWFAFGSANPASAASLAPTFISFASAAGNTTAPSITETPAGSGYYLVNYNPTGTVRFTMDGATTGLADSERYIFGVFDPQDMMSTTLTAMGVTLSAIGTTQIGIGSTLTAIGTNQTAMGSTISAIGTTQLAIGSTLTAIGINQIATGTSQTAIGVTVSAIGVTLTGIGNTLSALGLSSSAVGISLSALYALVGNTASSFGTDLSDPTTVFGFLKRAQEINEGNETYTKVSGSLEMLSRGSSQLLAEKTISDSTSETTKT